MEADVRRLQAYWCAVCIAATATAVSADTLVLRDGRRIQGTLVAVRDGTVEFEGQRGLFGRERMRVERADVVRIEFDEVGSGQQYRDDDRDSRDNRAVDGGRPSGMRERDVSVSASDRWTDTGITVRAGQTIYVSATGRVRWGPGRQDGPAGERNSPRNDGRPLPGRPAGALVGRVGDGDDVFFVGDDTGGLRMRGSGRLYLGVNDDFLDDNSGAFRATIHY
jgi:hypothetical protein